MSAHLAMVFVFIAIVVNLVAFRWKDHISVNSLMMAYAAGSATGFGLIGVVQLFNLAVAGQAT